MEFLNTPAFYMDDRFFDLFDEDEFLQTFTNRCSPISVPPCRHHLARSSSEFREDEEEDLERHMKDMFPAVESEFPAVKLGFPAVESNLKPSIETNRKEKAAENENQVHRRKAMTTKRTEEYVPSSSKVRKKAATTASKSMIELQCLHCGVKKTSQWQAGPSGPKTLCNACGIRYKSGRLCNEYRPANSPTFCPNLHSNFHRKIIQMRRHNSL